MGAVNFRIDHLEELDSTSEELFRRLDAGTAEHGDLVRATAQTAGRGRLGRRWHAEPGTGLYFSVLVAPALPMSQVSLTLAGGLMVQDLVTEAGLTSALLKWPNDLLIDGAKLAGVLVESRGFDPAAPRFVLGIGLNVGQTEFPAELQAERAVTSLALQGIRETPDRVIERLLPHLARRLDQALAGAPALVEDFFAGTGLAGVQVRVEHAENQIHEGRWTALDLARGVQLDGERWLPLEWIRALGAAVPGPPSLGSRD